jgi:dTDP-glucose pyrophosphorylase
MEKAQGYHHLQVKWTDSELYLGHVIQGAIGQGVQAEAVIFSEGKCLDIGTSEDLMTAVTKADYYVRNVS